MIRTAWLAASALALTAVPLAAQTARLDPARLRSHVETLGSDAYEGRGPTTRAETKTVNYLIAQLRAAGVSPGGSVINGKRRWTQDVPLLKSDIVGHPKLTLSMGGRDVALTQGQEIAVRSPLTGVDAVNIVKAPLVFVGYGVTAPERGWDDFKDVDVRGKIIVVLVNDPDFEGGEGQFGGKAMTYYGRWTYKFEEAARRGAAGVLVVHETAPASYGWATVKNSNSNTMFDIVRADPTSEHTPLDSWIQRPRDADFRRLGTGFRSRQGRRAAQGFPPDRAQLAA